jgi:hypothetical protein
MDTSSTSFYAQPAQKFQATRHVSCEGTASAVPKLAQEGKLQQGHERDTQAFLWPEHRCNAPGAPPMTITF